MKLSCVVPILNEEVNVKKFLEGYLTQTHKFHELIFVDGNSKDKTQEIIKEKMKENPEIKLVICNRKGPAAARNDGIDNATGDYITFFDADYSPFVQLILWCIPIVNFYFIWKFMGNLEERAQGVSGYPMGATIFLIISLLLVVPMIYIPYKTQELLNAL